MPNIKFPIRYQFIMTGARTVCLSVWFLTTACGSAAGEGPGPSDAKSLAGQYHRLGYVVVTPDGPEDGGDFGPRTPGTKTAGIQEALAFARKSGFKPGSDTLGGGFNDKVKNLYICRGFYFTDETITVPWMGEDWVLEATGTFIGYRGTKGAALVIDGQMNNQLRFGYILAGRLKEGAVVHIRPTMPSPHAPKGVVTCSRIEFYGIVGSGSPFSRKERAPVGTGLLLDASSGPILFNTIFVNEINACGISLDFKSPPGGSGIVCNDVHVPFNHLGNTPLQLGAPGMSGISNNRITMHMEGLHGARISGNNNTLELLGANVESGPEITFEASARDNVVRTTSRLKAVEDKSAAATNRIVSNAPAGFSVATPAFPASGAALVNRTACCVEVGILSPGKVSSWEEIDATGIAVKFDSGLTAGQHFTLAPGERVKFNYTERPTWRWKGLR